MWKGLFFCSDVFYLLSLSLACARVHYSVQARWGLWNIMRVNDALRSPPSPPHRGVMVADTAGHRRRGNRNTLLLKSHCSPPLRGVSCRGNGGSGWWWRWRGEVQPLSLPFDTRDFFLIFPGVGARGWNMEDDLIKFILGWIQMQSGVRWLAARPSPLNLRDQVC